MVHKYFVGKSENFVLVSICSAVTHYKIVLRDQFELIHIKICIYLKKKISDMSEKAGKTTHFVLTLAYFC